MPATTNPAAFALGPREQGTKRRRNAALTPAKENTMLRYARSLNNDEDRYQAAVDMAKLKLSESGRDDVSEQELKDTIDSYYSKTGANRSARDIRGENVWTDIVGGARDAINGFNTGVGNALDWAFDNTAGEFGSAIGMGDSVKNWFDGEDLAIIPDIATDIALYASGVGIPVAVAKNAIQLSPYMDQAITGRDAITNEEMDLGQRAVNGLLGFGGTALSALPGIGKVRNIATAASDKTAGAALSKAGEASTKAAEATTKAQKAYDEALEKFAQDIGQKEGGEAFFKASDGVLEPTDAFFKNLDNLPANPNPQRDIVPRMLDDARGAFDSAAEKSEIQQLFDKITSSQNAEKAAAEKLAEAREYADKTVAERVSDIVKDDFMGIGKGLRETPSVMKDSIERLKNTGNGRKIARKVNNGTIELAEKETPSQAFKRAALEDYAKKNGMEVGELSNEQIAAAAKEYGVRSFDDIPVKDLDFAARKRVSDAAKNAKNQAQEVAYEESKRSIPRRELKQIGLDAEHAAREAEILNRPVDVRRVGARRPLAMARTVYDDATSNLARNLNNGAPGLPAELSDIEKMLAKNEKRVAPQGFFENLADMAKRGGSAAKSISSPWIDKGVGMLAGLGSAPLAEMANSGEGYGDAMTRLWNYYREKPMAVAPALLTGSKGTARRLVPSFNGNIGRSSMPHTVSRSLGTAKMVGNNTGDISDLENEGYLEAIRNLRKMYEEER